MCRLYGFHASEPTKVECTLVYAQNALLHQSRADRRGVSHADGWGIGYYEHVEPTVERRAAAAFRDVHFALTAERVYACVVVAHVRLATVGAAAVDNTHPFHHDRWLFAHNGTLRGFEALAPRLRRETDEDLRPACRGTTDSETAFLWLLSRIRWARSGHGRRPSLAGALAAAVVELARRSEETDATKPPRLNFLLTDGRVMLASRWNNSLHWLQRDGIRDCEICGIPHVHHAPGHPYRAVVIASEPISHEPWIEVPDHHVLVIDSTQRPTLEQIAA